MRTLKKSEVERRQGKRPAPKKKAAVPAPPPPPPKIPEPAEFAQAVSDVLAPLLDQGNAKVDMLAKLVEAMHEGTARVSAGDGDVTLKVNRDQNGLIDTIDIKRPERVIN